MAYQKFTKRRYAEGVALGELIRQKAGECHDSALLSYLVFQQVREVDPEFDVRMVKASTHSGDPHIFSVVSTPNRQVFIIDPIVGWSDRVATYTSALRNELVNQSGMYSEIRYAYEFSHELAACQLMLERPRIIQWLKRFLPGL